MAYIVKLKLIILFFVLGGKQVTNNYFVFFVQTGKEQMACDFLNKMMNDINTVAFIPKIEVIYKKSKNTHKELKPMFAGYVIVRTLMDAESFITEAIMVTKYIKWFINLLGKQEPDCMALNEQESNFILSLCNKDYIVEQSLGLIKGDQIIINSGPLKGRESRIKRIDRHKRRALIELQFMGQIRNVYVSLEILSKSREGFPINNITALEC